MTYSAFSQFINLYRERLLETCIGIGVLGGLSFIIFSLVAAFYSIRKEELQVIDPPLSLVEEYSQPGVISSSSAQIVVEVTGAVVSPGVYKMPLNSRVQEAIQLAGGFNHRADTTLVAQEINLAKRLEDQEKVYIPPKGAQKSFTSLDLESGKVSVNTATQKQLEDLPTVGEKTAEKIISFRPYSSIEQFFEKMKLSTKQKTELQELISL